MNTIDEGGVGDTDNDGVISGDVYCGVIV